MENNYSENNYSQNTYNGNSAMGSYQAPQQNDGNLGQEAPRQEERRYNPYNYNPYEYGNQQTYRQAMQMPNNEKQPKPKKEKKGFGRTIGKTVAAALVFGLVGGAVFTGVSYAGVKALGIDKAVAASSNSVSSQTNASASIQQTSTGHAKELTDVSSIVEETMPSVVAITNTGVVTYQTFFGAMQKEAESCGSGIIIDKDDEYLYVATNNHVVSGAETLSVQFCDDASVEGTVQGTYVAGDLAVVKVALSDIEADTLNAIKIISIGDSDELTVGEATIAIGNALGYGQSVTTGIVSALKRSITVQDETTGETITNNNLIQTDAAINPGNSGGALLNAKGQLIGINSAKYSETSVEGIGYAIPITDAMEIIEKLMAGETVEKTQTAYIGIQGEDVSSDLASVYRLPEGVYVVAVVENSGAANAGVNTGDIITAVDGHSITTMEELQNLLCDYKPGNQVKVTLYRMNNGYQKMELTVTLQGADSVADYTPSEDSKGQNGQQQGQGQQGQEQEQPGQTPQEEGSDSMEESQDSWGQGFDPFEQFFGDFGF